MRQKMTPPKNSQALPPAKETAKDINCKWCKTTLNHQLLLNMLLLSLNLLTNGVTLQEVHRNYRRWLSLQEWLMSSNLQDNKSRNLKRLLITMTEEKAYGKKNLCRHLMCRSSLVWRLSHQEFWTTRILSSKTSTNVFSWPNCETLV